MKVSCNPAHDEYVAPEVAHFEVTLDERFFTLGPVYIADEAEGFIMYYVTQDGHQRFDHKTGTWEMGFARGRVRIYELPVEVRPS